MTATDAQPSLLWPAYRHPDDLAALERIPLADRGLPTTTWEIVSRAARLWPDRPAAHILPDGARWDRPRTVTFAELAGATARTAARLGALGVGRRDVVGILSPNTAELIPALLGAQAAGIAAPVNPTLRPDEIVDLLRRSRARVLVAAGPELDPRLWDRARTVASAVGVTALLALRPTAPDGEPPGLDPVPGVVVAHLDPFDPAPAGEAAAPPAGPDLAGFFHTGGTTATPKLAAHTHAMQTVDAWAIAAGTDVPDGAATFAGLPLFHVNALMVTLLAPLLRGGASVWAGPLGYRDPDLARNFWRVVERYRVAVMSGVPTVYEALSRVPVDADLSGLELCVVGAAPLPRSVADAWSAHTGVPLCEGYGLTEATCASARTLPAHPVAGSVGLRLPYQEIKAVAVDPDTGQWSDRAPGQVGTLVIRGPVVFPGYLVGHDETGPVLDGLGKLHDGWLDTGDLGSVDADGLVRLTGRAKDLIIRGGHNIDPAAVEAALRSHPRVRDASAVGRPDQHSGEVPVAYVVLHDDPGDPSPTEQELLDWAAAHVPEPAAAPKAVTVVPALPVTAVGKPHKVPLREDAARRELAPRLAAVGVAVPDDGDWCRQRDGRLTVRLVIPAPATRTRARAVLDHYAVTAEIEGHADTTPDTTPDTTRIRD